jgi:hypothetical protein
MRSLAAAHAVRILACVAFPLWTAAAGAQRSVLRGRVVAPDSLGGPAPGADVLIGSLSRSTRAGEDGSFSFDALPAGTYELTARRLGHEPVTRRVTLQGADTVTVLLPMAPRVQTLAEVEVRDSVAPAVSTFRAFERERARANGGAFVSDTVLAMNEHSVMSNVLRRIPGAQIARIQFDRRSYNVLASRRNGQGLRSAEKYCYFQVYVDGSLRYAPAAQNVLPPPDVDEFKVQDYEAIEVYRGPAQTPVQFGGTGAPCGTIVFWTRTRR